MLHPRGKPLSLRPLAGAICLLVLWLFPPVPASAADAEAKRRFDLPAGEATHTLKLFASQAQREMLFPSDAIDGVTTNAVKGLLAPREALDRLIAHTGLVVVEESNTGAFMVNRAATAQTPPAQAPPETPSPATSQQTNNPPMNPKTKKKPLAVIGRWLALALAPLAQAADNPPVTDNKTAAPEETIQLNPFEVTAETDKSYGALNSNSITLFKAELAKLPMSADIFTDAFMKDIGADGIESMIQNFSPGAGFSTSDPSTSAATTQPGDRNGNAYIQLRGLNVPLIQRDSLMSVGSFGNPGSTGVGKTDNFDLQSVEVIRGPQSLLYGAGGAGGVVNVVSKQAAFNSNKGSAEFKTDQYGSKRAVLDLNAGTDRFAARAVLLNARESGRRINIGGEVQGAYVQFAVKVLQNTFPTVIRLNGEQTTFKRILSSNISFSNAATGDTRNGANLHYLLLTNQTGATNPITGAAYASGAIDGGRLNWGNVDSYQGWQASEIVVDDFTTLVANTKWANWLSTQASVGYNDYRSDRVTPGSFSFYAPTATGNGVPNQWALGGTPADSYQPARTKAVRFSAVANNDLFHGRVHSDTILGADFTRTDLAQIAYSYFQADANFNANPNNNLIPGVTANGGRTALPKLFWSIDNGPMEYALFSPRASQITINGVNYVRQLSNPPNAAIATPGNPHGVILGGANYIITKYLNKGIFGVNNMHWLDGKLETLAGFRAVDILEDRLEQGSAPPAPPTTDKKATFRSVSYNAGVNYALLSWLRPYVAISDSFDPPIVQQVDPLGNVATTAHGLGGEFGLKFNNESNTFSGSLSLYSVKSKNEEVLVSSTIQNDINPSGLNGRFGASNQWVNVDRKSSGAEINVTAAPTKNWRMRFGAATVDGTIESTKAYAQVYNDQFYADPKTGAVLYADGSPVWVKPTFTATAPTAPAGTAGAFPLTLALMNDKTSIYWANPVAVSGAITSSSNVATVLKFVDPSHGAILTGRTGLPISAIQIDPTTAGSPPPPGTIVAAQAGDKTAGYYRYSANTTQTYTFTEGMLKGLRLGGSALVGWNNRNYYYYPNGIVVGATRQLFAQPHLFRFDLITGYEHKFQRFTWSTQVNVTNLFNRYHIYITPNSTTGYSSINGLNATFDQQPRAYSWTNTISF